MITSALVTSTDLTNPGTDPIFTASVNGSPVTPSNAGQACAITTIAFVNPATPNLSDETAGAVKINVWLVRSTETYDNTTWRNLIVKELIIPAGETVFFNEERIILDSADEIWVSTNSATANSIAVTVSSMPV